PELVALDEAERLTPVLDLLPRRTLVNRRGQPPGRQHRVQQRSHLRIRILECIVEDDEPCDRRFNARSLQEYLPDPTEHTWAGRDPPADIERGRHRYRAREIDPPEGGAEAVEATVRGRYAHRAAGITAEREVADPGGRRGRRPAGGAAREPTRRARIDR